MKHPVESLAIRTALVLLALAGGARAQEPPAQYDGRDAAHWAAQLEAESVDARRRAVYALYQVGGAARPHVRAIARRLRDSDEYVRTTAERVLARWGFSSTIDGLVPALPELIDALGDERDDVRLKAVGLIYRVGPVPNVVGGPPPPDALVPALATALADPEPKVRANAAACLLNVWRHAKPAWPALRKAVADEDDNVRLWVLRVAPVVDAAAAVEPALTRLEDASAFVRGAVAAALGQAPTPASDEVHAALGKLLADEDQAVRIAAVDALRALGEPRVAPVLGAVLAAKGDPVVRGRAAEALGGLGDPAVLPTLLEAFQDDAPTVRGGAVRGVGWLGPEGATAMDRLVPLLADADADAIVRSSALAAVAKLAPWAAPAVPALVAILEGDDPSLRGLAASTLFAVARSGHRDPRLLAAAMRGLAGEPDVVQYHLQIVAEFGAAAGDAVPALDRLLAPDSGWENRRGLHWTVAALGPAAAPLAGRLEAEMEHGQDPLGAAMALVLVAAGDEARARAMNELLAAARDERRFQATYLLHRLGPRAAPAAQALRGMLEHESDVRFYAAATLLQIGGDDAAMAEAWYREHLPKARTAAPFLALQTAGAAAHGLVPSLLEVANDPAHPRRSSALRTLYEIDARGEAVRAAYERARGDARPAIRRHGALGLRTLEQQGR